MAATNEWISNMMKWGRFRANMTQEDLAKKMEKGVRTIRSWENGKERPDKGNLFLMEHILSTNSNGHLYFEKKEIYKILNTLVDIKYIIGLINGLNGTQDKVAESIEIIKDVL